MWVLGEKAWAATKDFGLSSVQKDVPRLTSSPGTNLITGEGLSESRSLMIAL